MSRLGVSLSFDTASRLLMAISLARAQLLGSLPFDRQRAVSQELIGERTAPIARSVVAANTQNAGSAQHLRIGVRRALTKLQTRRDGRGAGRLVAVREG